MVTYDNEFRRKENKISAKDKIEPEHIHSCQKKDLLNNFSLEIAGLKELQIQINTRSKRPSFN